MPQREDLTKRLPSLAEHLGDGARADGFEEWVRGTINLQGTTPDEELWLRLARTFSIACVEQMSRESDLDPSPQGVARALAMWSRVAGFVTITAVASVCEDDAPFRKLARTLAEDFKVGAKMAADQLANGGSDAA